MSAPAIIYNILFADSGVSAIAGGRIFPVWLPQKVTLPAIVMHLVRVEDERLLSGQAGYPEAPMIIDAIGSSFDEADSLGAAVKAALTDFRGQVEEYEVTSIALDDLDHFDKGESGNHWRRRIGFRVRYRTAVEASNDND